MEPASPIPVSLRAFMTGPLADVVLRWATRLEVVTAYARSFYAKDHAENLVCFVRDGLEPGPLNILCGGWPEEGIGGIIEPGESLSHKGGQVWASSEMEIRLADSAPWMPPPWPKPDAGKIRAGLENFRALPASLVPQGSIAKLLFGKPEEADGLGDPGLEGAILAEFSRIIEFHEKWLRGKHHAFVPQILFPIGLGIGLTPSGDDFIGGMLLAMHAMSMTEAIHGISRHLLDHAGRLTNPISAAHLTAAAQGLGAEALHHFTGELMRGGERVRTAAERLGGMGHSSGWDAATGAVLVLDAFADSSKHA